VALRRLLALAVTLSFGSILALVVTRRPSNDRVWAADHARLPRIRRTDSLVTIENLRDFRYRDETHFTPAYRTQTFRLDRLRTAWFVLAPFSAAWRGPAHSFVSFGFDDSSFVAISIEARREATEEYSTWLGLGRNYELIYVIGDERDLIAKRAAIGDQDVYLYPVRAPVERIRAVFVSMLDRAERLAETPEFYHTIWNNCTSNLVRHVNQAAPGRIPVGIEVLLPGYADQVGQALGLLPETASVAELRGRYRINDRARAAAGADDFSLRIRR
jgi:Domain of unknown function (DUF4105)